MRDLLLLASLLYLVPVSLMRPWIGVLGWFWISYFVPHSFTWGFGRRLPVAMLVGGATLVGFLFTRDRKPLPGTLSVVFLLLFGLHITITSAFAFNPELSWIKWNWVAKGLLMTLVTMCLFQDPAKLRNLYMVPAICLGLWGLKSTLFAARTGGGSRVSGPTYSFFADNNEFGLALCMALPLMLYLSREEPRLWLKRVLRLLFATTCVAIVFTYSRGAFLGLSTVLAVLIWRSPWRLRFAGVLLIVSVLAVPLAPEALKNRFASIRVQDSAETRDGSAAGRIEAWTTAWRIAVAHPITGEGFRALWNEEVWNAYFGYDYLTVRDVHSLYFEVLSEHGFLGFGLYASILLWTLFSLSTVRRRWRGDPTHGYLSRHAEMTQLALLPFLVAGAFLSFAYFDLYFLLVATTTILVVLSKQAEAAATAVVPTAALPADVRPRALTPPRRPAKAPQPRTHHA